MDKTWLINDVCAGYCTFYNPGKNEELACKGFIVLQVLSAKHGEIPENSGIKIVSRATEDNLFLVLCVSCPFFDDGCDFAAWRRGEVLELTREGVNPCGGFLFLGSCLDQGTIDIQAINQVI